MIKISKNLKELLEQKERKMKKKDETRRNFYNTEYYNLYSGY